LTEFIYAQGERSEDVHLSWDPGEEPEFFGPTDAYGRASSPSETVEEACFFSEDLFDTKERAWTSACLWNKRY